MTTDKSAAPMTAERRAEIAEYAAKATPGPWLTQNEHDGTWSVWTRQPHIGTLATAHDEDINGEFPARANAHLIAAAPEMAAEVSRLSAEVERLREGLRQIDQRDTYSNGTSYGPFAAIARATLTQEASNG